MMEQTNSRQAPLAEETPEESMDVEKGHQVEPLRGPPSADDGLKRILTAQDWNGPDDPENPNSWPFWQRVYHT